jgi:hypothetical protein
MSLQLSAWDEQGAVWGAPVASRLPGAVCLAVRPPDVREKMQRGPLPARGVRQALRSADRRLRTRVPHGLRRDLRMLRSVLLYLRIFPPEVLPFGWD